MFAWKPWWNEWRNNNNNNIEKKLATAVSARKVIVCKRSCFNANLFNSMIGFVHFFSVWVGCRRKRNRKKNRKSIRTHCIGYISWLVHHTRLRFEISCTICQISFFSMNKMKLAKKWVGENCLVAFSRGMPSNWMLILWHRKNIISTIFD